MTETQELKLKIKIKNVGKIRKHIKSLASFIGTKEYVDYFFRSQTNKSNSELRIRKFEEGKSITLKILSSKKGIQENIEYKFHVDNANEFVNFLEYMGFKPFCSLRKSSEMYSYENIIIELANITKLGHYLELIIHGKTTFSAFNKKKLMELSSKLDLNPKSFETRYYSEMLQSKEFC